MQSCHRICSLSVKALRGQFSAVGNISTKKEIFCTPMRKLYTSNEFVKNNPLFYSNKTTQVVQHGKAHLSQASNPSLSSATSDSQENSDTFRYTLKSLDVSDIVFRNLSYTKHHIHISVEKVDGSLYNIISCN